MAATVDRVFEQRMRALERANEVRFNGRDIRRDIAAGRLTISEALDDPRAASLTVMALLMAQNRWGRIRAVNLLRRKWISELKRVRDLTPRQRDVLREALR